MVVNSPLAYYYPKFHEVEAKQWLGALINKNMPIFLRNIGIFELYTDDIGMLHYDFKYSKNLLPRNDV